jgi:hypothetical protein
LVNVWWEYDANCACVLQEEQARRRKVEEELRALKRGHASSASTAKGALSPR